MNFILYCFKPISPFFCYFFVFSCIFIYKYNSTSVVHFLLKLIFSRLSLFKWHGEHGSLVGFLCVFFKVQLESNLSPCLGKKNTAPCYVDSFCLFKRINLVYQKYTNQSINACNMISAFLQCMDGLCDWGMLYELLLTHSSLHSWNTFDFWKLFGAQ